MEKILITGVTNGVLDNAEQFQENLKYFEGKKIDLIVKNHKDKATSLQLRYFFGVVFRMISDYMDSYGEQHTYEGIYDYYKNKGYFGYMKIFDEPVPQGLSRASIQQASEAKERIQREWAGKGLVIPDPKQDEFIEDKIKTERYEEATTR